MLSYLCYKLCEQCVSSFSFLFSQIGFFTFLFSGVCFLKGDTCASVAQLFKITSLSGKNSPNPFLNCKTLNVGQQVTKLSIDFPNYLFSQLDSPKYKFYPVSHFTCYFVMQVCVSKGAPPPAITCTFPYLIDLAKSESCWTVLSSEFGGNATEFFRLNPGLYCDLLVGQQDSKELPAPTQEVGSLVNFVWFHSFHEIHHLPFLVYLSNLDLSWSKRFRHNSKGL